MRGPRAPTDRPRRADIDTAVAAYDSANPLTPLPRNAAHLPGTQRRLVEAGFLSWAKGSPPTYWLHLPPRRQG
jgi:hypothetical protein